MIELKIYYDTIIEENEKLKDELNLRR